MIKSVKDVLSDDFWIMPATPEYLQEGIPYITSKNIKNGVIDFSNANYISQESYDSISKNRPILCGDILISMIGTLGETAEVTAEDGMFYGQNMFLVRLDERQVNKKYFLNYFNSSFVKRSLAGSQNQSTQKYLKANHIENLQIPIPKLSEQESIAQKLDVLDRIIKQKKAELVLIDDLIKARFVEMFGDQESNPYGWKQTTVGTCCTLKSGASLPADIENEGGPIPYVKVGDMNFPGNERYITTSSKFVSEGTAGKGIFPVGSIIFPKRGGAIGTNKKRMTKLPICADLNVMGVSSNGELLPEYLMTYFDMIDLGSLDNGSSVPQINNKDISPLTICLPPIELQNEYSSFVKQVDKSKSAVQKAMEEAQLLFDSLMQKYFG